jgi:hypothetical protein
MPTSLLRQKLLKIHQIESEAIYSRESLNLLEGLWEEVRDSLSRAPVRQEDRELLAKLSRSHKAVASAMAEMESFLELIMNEAHDELVNINPCVY